MTKDFITYLLSFIGFVPIQQLQDEQFQEGGRDAEKNQLLVDSARVLSSFMNLSISDTGDAQKTDDAEAEERKKRKTEVQSWLNKLSKLTLCQLSSATSMDDPQQQVTDRRYERSYQQSVKAQKKQQQLQKERARDRRNSSSTQRSHDSGKDLPSLTSTTATACSTYYSATPSLYGSVAHSKLVDMSMTLEELKSFQLQARSIAKSLSHLRRSEQFAKANEVAIALEGMIRSLHLLQLSSIPSSQCANGHSGSHQYHQSSFFFILFGLIILGQESLYAPTEVRQTIFYQYKLGRRLILEMASVLKNFESVPLSISISSSHYSSSSLYSSAASTIASSTTANGGESEGYLYWWSSLYNDGDWLSYLQDVCSKLAKYDITWEFRKEYQDVAQMAERYFHNRRRYL